MQAFFLKGRSFSKVMKKPPHMWKQYLHPASGRRACAPLFALVGGVPTASIAMVTALVNAPGTVPVLPVCRCGTTLLMMANERRFPARYDKDCVRMLLSGLTDAQRRNASAASSRWSAAFRPPRS